MLPRIRKRGWWRLGARMPRLSTVEHSAVVVSEETLLDAIRPAIIVSMRRQECALDDLRDAAYCPRQPWNIVLARAWRRQYKVTLKEGSDPCRLLDRIARRRLVVPGAWLAPLGRSAGGAATRREPGDRAGDYEMAVKSGEFPAYARIASPLCAPGWLACGTAAMALRSDLRRRNRACRSAKQSSLRQ